MSNIVDFLREVYKTLENEEVKAKLAETVETIKFLQVENKQLGEQVAQTPLPEAPASATVKVVNPKTQMEWFFTVRGHSQISLLDQIETIEAALIKRGYTALDAYIDQRRDERNGGQHEANGNGGNNQPLTFQAKTLVASVTEGTAYWKVKGGQFTKFGVMIWPEILEAAGFHDLNPLETYELNGFTAVYTKKDDGKIDKVTSLVRQ